MEAEMTARNGSAGVLVACRCVEGRSSRRLIRRYRGYHRPIVSTPLGIGSELSSKEGCMSDKKTAIVTGASGGIGAGLVEGFLKQSYNVVATSLNASQSLTASPSLVLVDGDIGKQETAVKAVEAAIKRFGTIDVLVNKAPLNF